MADQAAPPLPVTPAPTPRRGRGRPPGLTDEVQVAILAAVRSHQRLEVAAQVAGVGRATLYDWLRAGVRAQNHVAAGGPLKDLSALQRRCMDFSDALAREMATAEAFAVRDIVHAGARPQVETRVVRRCVAVVDGKPVMVEETTTTTRPPVWQARSWWLEHRVAAYNPKTRHEHSGPDGAAIPVAMAVRLEGLAAAVAEHQAAIQAESQGVG